jgi:hypothetical protein
MSGVVVAVVLVENRSLTTVCPLLQLTGLSGRWGWVEDLIIGPVRRMAMALAGCTIRTTPAVPFHDPSRLQGHGPCKNVDLKIGDMISLLALGSLR